MFNIVVNGEVVGNGNSYQVTNSIFSNNTNITDIDLNNISFINNNMGRAFDHCSNLTNVTNINENVTDMSATFLNCSNLVDAPVIPNSVTHMRATFEYCNNLVNASEIPNSVTDMFQTFFGCSNLVNAPVIPNSVTDMGATFWNCTNLVNAPVIPNSVIDMIQTFSNCNNLVNAPVIPNSVTDMSLAFNGCSNLSGNIYIHSENITNAQRCFYGTSLEKNVYIPCSSTYEYTSNLYAFYNSSSNYDTYYTDHNIERIEGRIAVYDSSGNVIDRAYASTERDPENPNQFVLIVNDRRHDVFDVQYNRDSSKDISKHIPIGGVSKTYKSFLQSGYSTTKRVNGVLIFDINGNPIPE